MNMPSLEELNSFDPGLTHRWLVKIDGLAVMGMGAGFIPCTSVNENVGGVSYFSFVAGVEEFHIPNKYNRPSIDITYIDDYNYTLSKLFNAWSSELFNYKAGTSGDLNNVAKKLTIYRYDRNNEIDSDFTSEYMVVPQTGSNFIGSNSPTFITNTMAFYVESIIKNPAMPD